MAKSVTGILESGSAAGAMLGVFGPSEHRPSTITVDEEVLRSALAAVERGREHVESVLAEHDAAYGRATARNRVWAEALEKDLAQIEAARVLLRKALHWD